MDAGHYLNVFPVEQGVERERDKLHEHDQQSSVLQADTDPDRRAESASERLGELLSLRVPQRGVCPDQPVRTSPSQATPEETQPATAIDPRGSQRATSTINSWAGDLCGQRWRNCLRSPRRQSRRKPDAGNPHVRFDEGGGTRRARHATRETHPGKP